MFDQLEEDGVMAVVSPYAPSSNAAALKKLNYIIKRHQIGEAALVSQYFDVGVTNIHLYWLAKKPQREVLETDTTLDLLYPERRRLTLADNENAKSTTEEPAYPGALRVLHKQLLNGPVYRYIKNREDAVKVVVRNRSNASWLLVMGDQLGTTFPTAVMKNDPVNSIIWNWAYVVECQSEAEANKLKEWLASKEIIDWLKRRLDSSAQGRTISKTIFLELPWYE